LTPCAFPAKLSLFIWQSMEELLPKNI